MSIDLGELGLMSYHDGFGRIGVDNEGKASTRELIMSFI
jgi:hypothetical protein